MAIKKTGKNKSKCKKDIFNHAAHHIAASLDGEGWNIVTIHDPFDKEKF